MNEHSDSQAADLEHAFEHDKERNVTLHLASFLDRNRWDVVACHPPGGHTSFSMLSGRRSRGSYMPDVVAIKYDDRIADHVVIIAESKAYLQDTDADIMKLRNLDRVHAAWIAFRLQNHIDSAKWIAHWEKKLQRLIAFDEGVFQSFGNSDDIIVAQLRAREAPRLFVGPQSPARDILYDKAAPHK